LNSDKDNKPKGVKKPKIAIVGEAWGEQEENLGHPFVGPSGIQLLRCLEAAGLLTFSKEDKHNMQQYWKTRSPYYTQAIWGDHPEFYLTNVFNLRPKPTNAIENLCGTKTEGIPNRAPIARGKYVRKEYEPELTRLYAELSDLRPNVIIALGSTAAWALIGQAGIRRVRGAASVGYSGLKVVASYHPSAILRQYALFPILVADLQKAYKESFFPEVIRPQRFIHVEPYYEDLLSFEREFIGPSDSLAIDIETAGNQITCIGFAPSIHRALVVPFMDETKPDKNYWSSLEVEQQVWRWVRRICGLRKARIVGQNFNYDMKFLLMSYGIPVPYANHDTMLLHHALQPELEKSLAFMGSIYTDELAWKFMRPKHQLTVKKED
jgi:uracil-DNA glycosylase